MEKYFAQPEKRAKRIQRVRESKVRNKESFRLRDRAWRTGHTKEHHAQVLAEQNGKCPICGRELVKLHCDHDHSNGKPRGVLCISCNMGLGFIEKHEFREACLRYLQFWRERHLQ